MAAALNGDDEAQQVSGNRCDSVARPERDDARHMVHPNAELSEQSRKRMRRKWLNDVAAAEADGGSSETRYRRL